MRLLWFSNETPDVGGQGGQRRQYFQIRALHGQGHHVDVVTLAGPQDDTSIRPYASVRRLRTRVAPGLPDPLLAGRVRRLVRSGPWDRIVVAHTPVVGPGCERPSGRGQPPPVLVDMHNVLGDWYERRGEPEAARRRWRAVEADIGARSDLVTVCSDRERSALGAVDAARVEVVPHGVDPVEWTRPPTPAADPVVKLFGNWGWQPNTAGLAWFVEEVWPEVHARTGAPCEVAGSDAEAVAGGAGVTVVGRVPRPTGVPRGRLGGGPPGGKARVPP